MVKKKKKVKLQTYIQKRTKTHGLFFFLGLISILAFAFNTYTVFTGKDLTGTFAYASVLLGIGLMVESQIKSVLSPKRKRKIDDFTVMKLVTFLIGLIVFTGGILTLPVLKISIEGNLAGAIGFANLIAIIVIIYEIFVVD